MLVGAEGLQVVISTGTYINIKCTTVGSPALRVGQIGWAHRRRYLEACPELLAVHDLTSIGEDEMFARKMSKAKVLEVGNVYKEAQEMSISVVMGRELE